MARDPKLPALRRSLRRTFGFEQLRPGQAEVIRAVLEGEDALAVMPTGAGKSLCYQLPALHLEGTTIIVSPLISLMKDQADKLRDLGLDAVQVDSTLGARVEADTIGRIEGGRTEFVFTTPERLTDPDFLATLRAATIDFVVIDEAHCISQWGHDFRPSYLGLRQAVKELGDPAVLALTATATEAVVDDIRRQLGRPGMRLFTGGIYRPNLHFSVEHLSGDDEKRAELLRQLDEAEGAGIVYTATVRHVEELTRALEREGLDVAGYHGKLAAKRRHEVQERFMAGDVRTLVATNAFGMGIDKADIRFVIHYDLPGSLEAYYQEAGRAGRDGEPARCVLLYDARDRRTQLFFMGGRYPTAAEARAVHAALERLGAQREPVSLAAVQSEPTGVAKTKTRVVLSMLKVHKVVRERSGARFHLLRAEVPDADLARMADEWRARGEGDRAKLERMEGYARSARCRWRVLHDYFGEEFEAGRCGECDNCRKGLAALGEGARDVAAAGAEDEGEGAGAAEEIGVGEAVLLPKHGVGRVEEVEGEVLAVRFDDGELRRFRREFARKAG